MPHHRDLADDMPIQLAVRLPKALHRAMKIDAVERQVSVQAWIQDALEAHLKRVNAGLRDAARSA
jgi:predicted HicB family RNase H-like nuclease